MNETVPQIAYLEKPRNPGYQVSLRTLMVFTSIVAFITGAIVVPEVFGIIAVGLFLLMTPTLLLFAIFGRGWIRPFAIGGLIPHVVTYILAPEFMRSPEEALIAFAFSVGATVVVGLATACGHGWLRKSGGFISVPNLPFLRKWLTNE